VDIMNVGEIMTRDVACCRADQSLLDAVRLMNERDCGCVPVVAEGESVVGIVTDRDACMAELRFARPFGGLTVADAMSSPVVTCRAEDAADAAQQLMRSHQVRRLPVVDDHHRLVGLVSLSDIIREAARQSHFRFRSVFAGETAHTLAAVSFPHQSEEARRAASD
jgi:CBS-domain-containing membrane protein